MYQGTYDLSEMAKDLSETIICGNWSDGISQIRQLNGLQSLYLINEFIQGDYLSTEQINRLAMIAANSMNDGESGEGYIAYCQSFDENDDEDEDDELDDENDDEGETDDEW